MVIEDLEPDLADLIQYTWRMESEEGNPPTPIEKLVERYSLVLTAAIEFANPCNLPESGKFGEKGACGSVGGLPQRGGRYKDVSPAKRGGDTYGTAEHEAVINAKQGDSNSAKGSSEEQAAAHALASRKTAEAPVPPRERVKKARLEIQAAQKGTGRPGGESRGGSSYDRRNSRVNLFDEFGGFSRGYVVDPDTGIKLHWADPRPQIPNEDGTLRDNPDHIYNPDGYPPFERSRIFTHAQGGGYQQPNIIPESFSTNRARSFRPVRPENQQTNRKLGLDIKNPARFNISEQARFALKRSLVTQFYNKCHSPEDGKFCETEGGGSVSATISDVPRYFQFTVKDSLALISQVHGVRSDMPKIPVVEVPAGKNTNGYFQFGTDNSPTEIGLNTNGPHPHFTFIHEYGHFLDNSGHLLHPNSWNSDRTGDPPMEAFHKAVQKSQEHFELEIASRRGDPFEKGHANYLLNKRETFARAYTQWIATKTGNELLLEGLDIQRNDTDLDRHSQWSDEEFEPISDALDAIFQHTISASAVELHLQSQHDQKSHGRRGSVSTQADMSPSSALSALPRPKVVRAAVNSALAAIDSVHNIPDNLKKIPIQTNSALKSQATYSYRDVFEGGKWIADLPVSIEINPKKSSHLELSMTHEYGHYMDSQVFGSNIGKDPDLQKVFQASKAMEQLRGYANNQKMGMQSRKRAAYYLQPHETFARAYAQWVAVRSGNQTMKDQVIGVLTFNHEGRALPVYSASQWSEKDFAPIATSMDELFRKKGLLK